MTLGPWTIVIGGGVIGLFLLAKLVQVSVMGSEGGG